MPKIYGVSKAGRIHRELQTVYEPKPETKRCSKCKEELPLYQFNERDGIPGGDTQCCKCRYEAGKAARERRKGA